MIICIDGNDGTGKTTLIARLKELLPQHTYQDRGLPSAMTVRQTAPPADLYFILDCTPELSQERLRNAGKDMSEHWHQMHALAFYRHCFLQLAEKHQWPVIESDQPIDDVVRDVIDMIPSDPFTHLTTEELEEIIRNETCHRK